jgi:arylsulfatase A-like enzyme/Tfp pilus assembly protein PilF
MSHPLPFAPPCGNSEGVANHPIIILSCLMLALCAPVIAMAGGEDTAPPSVILISIDTLRADHLSAYGYTKIRTPHIDSYAQGGTVFAQAEAQIPLTLPSHTSLFTSTYPFQNGVEENGERVPAGVFTLASALQSHGYKTAAFIGSDFLDRRYGLDQGIDEYDSPFGLETTGVINPLAKSLRRDGALVVRAARLWLDAHRGQPVFVFVHLFDLHVPYTLPAEVAQKQGISRYDAQLKYVDQVMGRFQADLKQSRGWDRSLVVVFGDHGEGLGNHRETDHGYYVYESTLHVPLIFHWPGGVENRNSKMETPNPGRVSSFEFPVSVSTPVGLIDVAPTILDYLHLPAPPSFEGASQLGALKSQESARPGAVYSESLYAHDAFDWAPLRALRVGKYKYIQAPKAELYDLHDDPGEHLNLLPRNGAMAAEFQNELAALLARYAPQSHATPSALSPETLAQLESLGYLAAAPRGKIESSGPDPKDRFAEFELYQNAYVDFTEGRTAAALAKFQAILKSDPQNTLARFHLGECYLQLKKPPDALREWATTLKLDPQYAPAAESIGEYWLGQGDYAKARLRFQQVVALTPESFTGHLLLGIAAAHLGLVQESSAHMQIACKIAPHDDACTRKQGPMGGSPGRKKY